MKRISPFLALAIFLTIFLVYTTVSGHFLFSSIWLSTFAFLAVIVNLVFFDFILKKYYQGKNPGRIMVMETIAGFVVLYFMVFQDVDPGNHITHIAKMIFH